MGLNPYIVDISQVYKLDEDIVGKKAHELGRLWELGIPLPNGFVITTQFFKEFLRLTKINTHPAISDCGKKQVMLVPLPQMLSSYLHKFYRKLAGMLKEKTLNIYSSSFNNKSIMFTNVKGDANLVLKIKAVWSRCFGEPVAIAVQQNIKSDMKGKIETDNPTVDKRLTKNQMDKLISYCKIVQKHFYFPKILEYAVTKEKIFITKVLPFTGKAEQSSQNSLDKTLYRKYFQIPTVEGARNATHMFKDGNIVTVNGVSGEIYSGGLVWQR